MMSYMPVRSCVMVFFFQAEDGIRDLVRSRGLGDVYKRQGFIWLAGILGERIRYDLRQKLFGHLQQLSLTYYLSLIHI